MKNHFYSALALSCGLGVMVSLASPVQAAEMTFDFTVDIADGPLSGRQFTGSTTFDTDEVVSGSIEQPEIRFNFLDKIFTEADDIDFFFGLFPTVEFEGERFLGINYVVDESAFFNPVDIPGETSAFGFFPSFFGDDPATFDYSTQDGNFFFEGVVTYTERTAPVPEPSILAALLMLGTGLGLTHRKQQHNAC